MAVKQTWGPAPFLITCANGTTSTVTVKGRDRWALEALGAAGTKGCTPINTPGPRWSGYVYNLRGLGVPIQTITEPHEGPFKGTHARYVLCASVVRVEGLVA